MENKRTRLAFSVFFLRSVRDSRARAKNKRRALHHLLSRWFSTFFCHILSRRSANPNQPTHASMRRIFSYQEALSPFSTPQSPETQNQFRSQLSFSSREHKAVSPVRGLPP